VDLIQHSAGVITAREFIPLVTVSARAFNQITYFKIKSVVRSPGCGVFSGFFTVSIAIATRTVC
jgi:hypothetical protein